MNYITLNDYKKYLLIDYLLLSYNLKEDFKKYHNIILDDSFIEIMAEYIRMISVYPKKIEENAEQIFNYIIKNKKGYEQLIKEIQEELYKKNIHSDYKYECEYVMKYSGKPYDNKEETKRMIVDGLENDFLIVSSFDTSDEEYEDIRNLFIGNTQYIKSIKKFLLDAKDLFIEEKIRDRVIEILEINLNILQKDEYKDYKEFKHDNLNIYVALNNLHKDPFNDELVKAYYNILKIEYCANYKKIDTSNIDIRDLYYLIEDIENYEINEKYKMVILSIMNEKRKLLSKDEIPEYNEHLIKLNNLYKGPLELTNEEKELKRYDLENLEFLLNDEYDENFVPKNFYQSVDRFLRECPNIFMDYYALNNLYAILEKDNSKQKKQIIKKLNKV